MRVVSRHGYFQFFPRNPKDVYRFSDLFGAELEIENDYFTFPALVGLPRYSIIGKPFGNLPATKTWGGLAPWDVMRENGFVYSIALGLLVPKAAVLNIINPPVVDGVFLAESPLIQPGSRNLKGQQILSFDGEFSANTFQFYLRAVSYE